MSPGALVLLVVAAVGIGLLIGSVGVGGVLLVPLLVLIAGLTVHEATPVATMSFFFTGVAGTVAYQRQQRIEWASTGWLLAAAIPGAFAGALTNIALSATAITIVIAVMLGFAAFQTTRPATGDGSQSRRQFGALVLAIIGVVVGFGSTLSGTGGPVLLIPILLLAGATVGFSVSASQPIQIPIAVFGTASFLVYGAIDWQLAIALGLAQAGGTVGGARISDRLPHATLRVLVSGALGVSAVIFLGKALAG